MRLNFAVPGAVVWLVSTIAFQLPVIESLFLWAPLVVVPLGLELIPIPDPLRRLQPAAAIMAAVSFAFPRGGGTATALAAPWALFCLALLGAGAARFLKRRRWDPEIFIDAALGLIAVGGAGLLMSRAGMKPGGFDEPIVLLTGVHFHYTGFAAPLIAGLAMRRAGPRRPLLLAGALIIVGTPLLAGGWTLRLPALKMVAVSAISLGLFILAMELVWIATDTARPAPRFLLGLAGFSICWGMVLAVLYAAGEYSGANFIAIPVMAVSHGILNGFGFATCGLLGARSWSS